MNDKGTTEAIKEFHENPPPKFHNKKFYNPEYHYYMEGPDIYRLYSQRDNSAMDVDFTEVLDSVYYNVLLISFR